MNKEFEVYMLNSISKIAFVKDDKKKLMNEKDLVQRDIKILKTPMQNWKII